MNHSNITAVIKRHFQIIFFSVILVTLIVSLQPIVYAVEPLSPEESMKQIERSLERFNRDTAYEQMKSLYTKISFETEPELYLKNMTYLVRLEKTYGLYDEMVKHAIELYDLTETGNHGAYRIEAIDALAYFDYLNYFNTKAADKLAEMSNYANVDQLFQYKLLVALLEIDEGNNDGAIQLYEEALLIPNVGEIKLNRYFNEVSMVHKNIASVYFKDKKYVEAVQETEIALGLIDEADIDFVVDLKLSLANYHYYLLEYEIAEQYLNEIYEAYDKTSVLFKDVLPINNIKSLEANLAYDSGDYKKASELYYELNQIQDNSSAIEENLDAKEAVSQFETAQTDKQLSVLEQLAMEQTDKNLVQKKYLTVAFITIVLLVVLFVFALWVLWWYNKQRQRFYYLSITDQLTQMYNRRRIIQEFEQIKLGSKCIALMDVDHFKLINDTYGHVVGDEVLIKIAETIKSSLRSQDLVGRYGGEEFLAILDTEDIQTAIDIAERIRLNIENINWSYPDMTTTISIGLTRVTQPGDALLAEADHLLYQSKAAGRNLLTVSGAH